MLHSELAFVALPPARKQSFSAASLLIRLGRPLQYKVSPKEMSMLEGGESGFRIAPSGKLEEGKTTRLVVHLARQSNGFELAVRATGFEW